MTIISTFIICITIAASVYCLANSNVKITITHKYPVEIPTTVPTQTEVKPQDMPPSMDDVLRSVNEIIGGIDYADN